ncbi:helix-turn-helix domain-containing protein [Halalkalicoccus tibetensis]|uniref:Helix-turn-helix domain-containing protein n=1 Tax=Halalkalicoccus tibetensis TaxID=175632 RepID=A0ABD5UY22_9EURY
MAAIIQLRVPATNATLGATVASVPEISMEVEQFANGANEAKRPLVWIRAEAFGDVDDALAGDPTVAEHSIVSEVGERRLYELAWADPEGSIFATLEEFGGHLRSAALNGDEWAIEVLFPTRERLSRMYDSRADDGIEMTVDSIYELSDSTPVQSLTDNQRRTLETALSGGYYDIPRETSLTDLSDELEVSHQALSERLRRAHKHLVSTALRGHSMGDAESEPEVTRP